MMNYAYLKKHQNDTKYDNRKVVRLILKIRKSSATESVKDRWKMDIFEMMGKIVVKNIDNFYFLFRPYKKSGSHIFDEQELLSEAYFAFSACLDNFCSRKDEYRKIIKDSEGNPTFCYESPPNFYFYFNKALTFRFKRYIEKYMKKHSMSVTTVEMFDSDVGVDYLENDFSEFELEHFELTDAEIELVKSRICGETISKFIERVEGMSQTKYYQILELIKLKIRQDEL